MTGMDSRVRGNDGSRLLSFPRTRESMPVFAKAGNRTIPVVLGKVKANDNIPDLRHLLPDLVKFVCRELPRGGMGARWR